MAQEELTSGKVEGCFPGTTAVILAGGKGTRIKRLYPDTPKPFIPVCGRPFIEWVLLYLRRQGISKSVLSLGHLADVAVDYIKYRQDDGMDLSYVIEESALGTAGAFMFAAKTLPECDIFIVGNGDSIVLAELGPAFELLDEETTDAVIVGLGIGDASRYGSMVVDGDMRLVRFAEKTSGQGLINAGIYLLKKRVLQEFPGMLPLSFEHDVFPSLIAKGFIIKVHKCVAPFLDIGTEESIRLAGEFINKIFGKEVGNDNSQSPC